MSHEATTTRWARRCAGLCAIAIGVLIVWPTLLASADSPASKQGAELPWRDAGLTERQAAAHLLDRFSYGPRPGEIDRVVDMGFEAWLEAQLAASLAEPSLGPKLEGLRALSLPARQIAQSYPNPGMVLRQAGEAGVIDRDTLAAAQQGGEGMERMDARRAVFRWAQEQGYRSQRELIGELFTQKIYRALYAENQLTEVLTDFWFNHFNVSLTDNQSRNMVLAYERDAIRPHVLGSFRDMLGATARHPAMLLYLDNAQSVADEGQPTTFDRERFLAQQRGFRGNRGGRGGPGRRARPAGDGDAPRRRMTGLNENYARELMELHTLGVDGGYDQQDVIEVARAFTGWTILPTGRGGQQAEQRLAMVRRRGGTGFVVEDLFLFRADVHDAAAKVVLGHRLAPGRGLEDGEEVLDLLTAHPSTARHLATKIAVRFVADEPPPALVDRLARTFTTSGGDLRAVVRAVAESPEFWASRRQKIKSPFEVAMSSLRALGAEVRNPRGVAEGIDRMGQRLYSYQAPTGFPDRAEAWVNTGALLSRMNFGLQLAAGYVEGVDFDLAALLDHREPESLVEGLRSYTTLLLPERDPAETLRRLEPVVQDPALAEKVLAALPGGDEAGPLVDEEVDRFLFPDMEMEGFGGRRGRSRSFTPSTPPSPLAQVVGVILGSPEFQRR